MYRVTSDKEAKARSPCASSAFEKRERQHSHTETHARTQPCCKAEGREPTITRPRRHPLLVAGRRPAGLGSALKLDELGVCSVAFGRSVRLYLSRADLLPVCLSVSPGLRSDRGACVRESSLPESQALVQPPCEISSCVPVQGARRPHPPQTGTLRYTESCRITSLRVCAGLSPSSPFVVRMRHTTQ